MRTLAKCLSVSAIAALLAVAPTSATILKQMNLDELAGHASRIFSGTVIEMDKGTLAVGGGRVATVTYRIEVDSAFRGEFVEKEGRRIAEIRMVADSGPVRTGHLAKFSRLPEMPKIEKGGRYLFFATAPSAVGLSTTVGLGQGCFRISGTAGQEMVANELDNEGLFRGMSPSGAPKPGPMPYTTMIARVHALLGGK